MPPADGEGGQAAGDLLVHIYVHPLTAGDPCIMCILELGYDSVDLRSILPLLPPRNKLRSNLGGDPCKEASNQEFSSPEVERLQEALYGPYPEAEWLMPPDYLQSVLDKPDRTFDYCRCTAGCMQDAPCMALMRTLQGGPYQGPGVSACYSCH